MLLNWQDPYYKNIPKAKAIGSGKAFMTSYKMYIHTPPGKYPTTLLAFAEAVRFVENAMKEGIEGDSIHSGRPIISKS